MRLSLFTISVLAILAADMILAKAGTRITVDNKILVDAATNMILPELNQKIGLISIDSVEEHFSTFLGKFDVNLTNIYVSIDPILSENLVLTMKEPSSIILGESQIHGKGGLHIKIKHKFFEAEKITLDVFITNLKFNIITELGIEKSSVDPQKNVPSLQVTDVDLDFNLNYKIEHHFFLKELLLPLKRLIIKHTEKAIKKGIKKALITHSKDTFSKFINTLPLTPEIGSGLNIDYSITEAPVVNNGKLVFSSSATIFNAQNPDTINSPFTMPENLPLVASINEDIQSIISSYSINTLLWTLTKENRLQFTITNSIIPAASPIKLDTTSLNNILPGLKALYGPDRPCSIPFKVTDFSNGVNLKKGGFSISTNTLLSILVDGETEAAVVFSAVALFDSNIQLQENGNLSSSINSIKLTSVKIVETKLPKINTILFQNGFNALIASILPAINIGIASQTVKIPTIKNIDLNKSQLQFNQVDIEVAATPVFTNSESPKFLSS